MAEKEKKKGGFFKKVLIGLGVIVLFGVVMGILSEEGEGDATSEKSSTENSDTETEESVEYSVGEAFNQGDLEILITDYEAKQEVGGEYFKESASEGATLVCVQYKFKNISDEPISVSPTINLIDDNDVTYEEDLGKTSAYAGEVEDYDEKILSDLNPGLSSKSVAVFEVSEQLWNEKTWRLEITTAFWGGDEIYIDLK